MNMDSQEECDDPLPAEGTDDVTAEKMRDALTAIALEIKRYRSGCPDVNHAGDLDICKSKLRNKRRQIKTLKENLKTACSVVKTVINAKKKEIDMLNGNLDAAKSESEELVKKNSEITESVKKLIEENQSLNEKYLNLVNFIDMGYKKLQEMRTESLKELPPVLQLKEIMLSCGQYYADFNNEREEKLQLEQKNRFLTNKLRILEGNLQSLSAEVQKFKFKEKNQIQRAKKLKDKQGIGYTSSENNFSKQTNVDYVSNPKSNGDTGQKDVQKLSVTQSTSFNLSSHLSLVKNLLNDQDTMLRDLKKLSDELSLNSIS